MPNQNNTQNNDQNYKDYVDEISPKPTYIKNYIMAFIVGGIICIIGQAINDSYMHLAGLDKKNSSYMDFDNIDFYRFILNRNRSL